jgi:hypothetical protein
VGGTMQASSSASSATSHTIDITLDPPLFSAREANLWLEGLEGGGAPTTSAAAHAKGGGGLSSSAGNSPSHPTLILSRVDGAGGEQRFPLPTGTLLPPPARIARPTSFHEACIVLFFLYSTCTGRGRADAPSLAVHSAIPIPPSSQAPRRRVLMEVLMS